MRLGAERRELEDARQRIASVIGAPSDQLLFTGGGTEALSIAVLGSASDQPGRIANAPLSTQQFPSPLIGWRSA